MFMIRPAASVALFTLVLAAACSDAASPVPPSQNMLFAIGGEGSSIFVVDPLVGKLIARPGPLPIAKISPVLSGDSSTVFFVGADQRGAAIYALVATSLRLTKWLDIDSPASRHMLDGIWLRGSELGSVPGDKYLYTVAYISDPTQTLPSDAGRIAVLDTGTRHVVGTVGPLNVRERGIAALPPGPAAPHGALLAIGTRLRTDGPSLDTLFVIDPVTRDVIDSALVTPPVARPGGTLVGIIASPDGRHVYLQHRDGILYGYDLLTRQIIGPAPLPGQPSNIAIAPDGSRLYAVYGGAPMIFIPAADSIEVLDAMSLSVLPPISLLDQAAIGGEPPLVHSVVVSPDGQWLYLADGAARQPLRVLTVDLASGKIVRVIPLGDSGGVELLVGR